MDGENGTAAARTVAARTASAFAVAMLAGCAAVAGARAASEPPGVAALAGRGVHFGVDPAPRVRRLAIGGRAQVLFSVRLATRRGPSRIDVRALPEALYCREADIEGDRRPSNPCAGTTPYDFTPRIAWKVVLAHSPTAIAGEGVERWRSAPCRDAEHHCPVAIKVNNRRVSSGGRYVNLVALAGVMPDGSSPRQRVERNQVLGVTAGAMQVIQRFGLAARAGPRPILSGPAMDRFELARGGRRASQDDDGRSVIFSQPVRVRAGDVLDVDVRATFSVLDSNDDNPLIAVYAFLAADAADTDKPSFESRRLAFDRAGVNCQSPCSLRRVGALPAPSSGRYHLNVVAVGRDHERRPGEVTYTGTLSVTRR